MSFAGRLHQKPYLEQWERINRWYHRLNKLKKSNMPENETNNQVDFIYAFFINCFHLRDWLIAYDPSLSDKINKLFEFKEMQICGDICNGCKHLSLTYPSIREFNGVVEGVSIHREFDPFQNILKYDNPIQNITYVILAGPEKFNLFFIVDRCMSIWKTFLSENGLL